MSFAMGAHAAFKVRDSLKANNAGNGDKWGGGQQSPHSSMKMSSSGKAWQEFRI